MDKLLTITKDGKTVTCRCGATKLFAPGPRTGNYQVYGCYGCAAAYFGDPQGTEKDHV